MLSRRTFLHTAAAYGLLSQQDGYSFASAPGNKRLVVIMLRGGMDGLEVVRPLGDKAYQGLRPDVAIPGIDPVVALDDFFAMHGALESLIPMFHARELLAVHAVSTPFRSRSHFQAQDLLEWGAQADERHESGWVNRLIGLLGGRSLGFASEVGASVSQLMVGPEPVLNVYPETELGFWANSKQFLDALYKDEIGFEPLRTQVNNMTDTPNPTDNLDPGVSVREIAGYVARLMKRECRLATFSLYGWDTHVGQGPKLAKNLVSLAAALLALKQGLGHAWQDTLVLAVSEFGRTARYNGTQGTDHGTGGVALFAGGALANGMGGKVLTSRWPGLDSPSLFEERDLMPTDDIRRYVGWALAKHFDLSPETIVKSLFPGLDMGQVLPIV
jgi:uncharacterized protein (DUF1501 family)